MISRTNIVVEKCSTNPDYIWKELIQNIFRSLQSEQDVLRIIKKTTLKYNVCQFLS